MHENLVAQAVIPRPTRICGLDMMNYSLGCELQLFGIKSPFLSTTGELDTISDANKAFHLALAVRICCRKQPRWHWLWKRRHFPKDEAGMALAIVDFLNYINAGHARFRADLPAEHSNDARYVGEPEVMWLYRFVCKNVPREEIAMFGKSAWDFPYAFAKLLSQGDAESKGNLEIHNVVRQAHEDFHRMTELARAAWYAAETDDAKRSAIVQFPIIKELLDLKEQVAAYVAPESE